ncbi:unnamed protein product [Penicillium salamii]|uniref:Uncharacterized protein n=1 Tax=Penicillium salamii TaxID=1612424 RepID=A0A9W4J7A9_9EURO|nr:unnamed protein product [Penicillium salamii]
MLSLGSHRVNSLLIYGVLRTIPMSCVSRSRLLRPATVRQGTLRKLPEVLSNFEQELSFVSNVAFSHQRRGLHDVSDVSTRQKYHAFQIGRGEQIFTAQLQAGQNMLLEMLTTPSLAGCLRRINLFGSERGSGISPHETDIVQRAFSPEDVSRIKQALTKAGIENPSDRESTLATLRQDPVCFRYIICPEAIKFKDVLVMMLAANAPNLEFLSTYPLEMPHSSLKSLLQRAANPSVPDLKNLRSISFHPDDVLNQGTTYVREPYFDRLNMVRKLPAIESVSFRLAMRDDNPGLPLPPRCANYSKIRIEHSCIPDYDLCRIIESPKALKSFVFTVGGRKNPEGGIPILSMTPLLQSLWLHRHTLVELDLDIEYHATWQEFYDPDYQPDEDEGLDEYEQECYAKQYASEILELAAQEPETKPSCISLKDFPKLKRLSLGTHTLLYFARGVGSTQDRFANGRIGIQSFNLAENLPPNLQYLCVYGRGERPHDLDSSGHGFNHVVDDQLERLSREMSGKSLIIEGIDVPIPNSKTIDEWEDDNDRSLYWKDPDDDRFDTCKDSVVKSEDEYREMYASMEDDNPLKPMIAQYLDTLAGK